MLVTDFKFVSKTWHFWSSMTYPKFPVQQLLLFCLRSLFVYWRSNKLETGQVLFCAILHCIVWSCEKQERMIVFWFVCLSHWEVGQSKKEVLFVTLFASWAKQEKRKFSLLVRSQNLIGKQNKKQKILHTGDTNSLDRCG